MTLTVLREDIAYDNIVRSRNHLENRGFSPWPECHITPWLKDYDENLDVWRNERTGKARIIDDTFHTITEVDAKSINGNTVEHIKMIDSRNGYRAIKVIEQNELKRQIEQDKKLEDMAYHLAQDMRKPLLNSHYYGG